MNNTATQAASRFAPAASPARPGLFRRLLRAYELRRAERQLSEMDDRMLRDMGLSRGDLERAVRGDR